MANIKPDTKVISGDELREIFKHSKLTVGRQAINLDKVKKKDQLVVDGF